MRNLLNPAHRSPAALDVALLGARVALGVILLAHGLQKLNEYTLAGTAASFGEMGVPAATLAAWFVTGAEILGGAGLLVIVLLGAGRFSIDGIIGRKVAAQ